ncbi:adenylate/guanylate cyclase domain-containing protein [Rhizobium sp. Root1220]|uniref:adenylate/guanylate cyclase domain-containing protein n=1 Tax=Rhizobium sp. Root1220 TaxID=1736432 RepID=UPI0006FD664D|nr:adenylate/guanylate cyclase domain-containing protein [Rhizobium sp. Root1220]KQV82137.1 adenylate cyclase [Rhizobium sp. Root1220]
MEAPPLQRKLAAILAADVEGYSRLMHVNEERTLATLTSHRTIVDSIIERANGEIFGTAGDSVLAEFPSIVLAFNAAVAMQQSIWRANQSLPDEERMNFRIGINVGDVLVKNGDIFGDGVNIAARLEGMADVGGICVTRGVRDHLRDRVDAAFEDLGEQTFKNIGRPLRVFRVEFDQEADPLSDGPRPRFMNADDESNPDTRTPYAEPMSLDHGTSEDLQQVEIAFWDAVRESNDPNEYKLYLSRFPDGKFVDLAHARLENSKPSPEDLAVEVAFWDTVRSDGNAAMIDAYLAKYPRGQFCDLARLMLATLRK